MAAEALLMRLLTIPVVSMRWLGTPPGVVIQAAAALNGPGVGKLRVVGSTVAWKAPKSATFGLAVNIPSPAGVYTLYDGDDPDKWIQVNAFPDYLVDATVPVYLEEIYDNILVNNFDASSVAAGTTNTKTMRLYNLGTVPIDDVRVWLSPLDPELPPGGIAGTIRGSGPLRRSRAVGMSLPAMTGSLAAGVITTPRRSAARMIPGASQFTPLPPVQKYTVSISSDNVSFVQPREEYAADTLVYGALAVGAFHTVWVRRTIPAGMVAEPRGRTDILTSFSSLY